ncbi:glycine betaine/L-proline ABC transporter substrate-binding protein ProX [Pseudomonas jinjuensis]|uniref:Glycine betaine/proline transport system substrate-binding protein n=1 Tax=Pseudomonas jinjuensis TaxID=198616 RepID=A0A1H0DL26_9PSED|nr:glycine betaine/L-proline ABC transporter substrate-binding protein ProX [Pseudomonas jinjuensis]SDN70860.1 glycine betaine/proline transport system substrate-binding protein [Pseudomonas jinjuensis]
MKDVIASALSLKKGLLLVAAIGATTLSYGVMSADLPGKGRTVSPVGIPLDEEVFQYQIVTIGLEKLGYKVNEVSQVQTPIAYLSVANGNVDFNADAWLPQHTAFYEKAGGDSMMAKFGPFSTGALQGYLIDKKTMDKYGIKSIDQLKDPQIAKLFDIDGDGKADLTGCEPGWGCEKIVEKQLDAYGLRATVSHNQGSYFALMANTIARYKEGKPILYYTWRPLWVSGVLVPGKDVEWLTVPFTALPDDLKNIPTTLPDGRNLGFPVNDQYIVANKKFIAENPAAKKLFESIRIPVDDINAQNLRMRDGENSPADIRKHAEEWVSAHQSEFDQWVSEAKVAVQ